MKIRVRSIFTQIVVWFAVTVVLSLIGLSRPGFPAAAVPQRAVMLVSGAE